VCIRFHAMTVCRIFFFSIVWSDLMVEIINSFKVDI
jgi:hypothetical protein